MNCLVKTPLVFLQRSMAIHGHLKPALYMAHIFSTIKYRYTQLKGSEVI